MKLGVGIFVMVALISIISFSVFLLHEKGAFAKRVPYNFYTESAQSFQIGMPVLFSGFEIGLIDEINLTNDGHVHITFSVTEENQRWITEDSSLMLKKPLIGSPYIEVSSTLGKLPLTANSTLTMTISDDINDIITKLEPTVEKLIAMIDNLYVISNNLANEEGHLFQTLNNIETFSEKLAQSDSLLTSLTGDKRSSEALIASVERIQLIVKDTHTTLKKVDTLVDNMGNKVISPSGAILQRVDIIMRDITDKLDRLDKAVTAIGSSDQDIILLREQIQLGIERSNELLDKVDGLLEEPPSKDIELP